MLKKLPLDSDKNACDIIADRLAVGVGDNMIRVCNVDSATHVSDTITLWQGIKSKVTTVSNCDVPLFRLMVYNSQNYCRVCLLSFELYTNMKGSPIYVFTFSQPNNVLPEAGCAKSF